MRLDSRGSFPTGMEQYLSFYGWHFSKKMEEWATASMYKEVNGVETYITPYTKEDVEAIMKRSGEQLNDVTYDEVYLANMAKADFLGSSIADEAHLAKFIRDNIMDPDGYEGMVFTRFYADCIGKGRAIHWEDVI